MNKNVQFKINTQKLTLNKIAIKCQLEKFKILKFRNIHSLLQSPTE